MYKNHLCKLKLKKFNHVTFLSAAPDENINICPNESEKIVNSLPPGYVKLDVRLCGYYKFHNRTELTWNQALEVCRQEGAHLLFLNSDQEAHAVGAFIQNNYTDTYSKWIGFHDLYEEGHYVTIFSKSLHYI